MSNNPPSYPPPAGPPPQVGPGAGVPPQQPGAARKGNAGIWILLLVLAVGGVGAFVLLSGEEEKGSGSGGGGASEDASSPEAAIAGHADAVAARDCTAMMALSSSATLDASGGLEASIAECEEDVATADAESLALDVGDTEVVSETGDSGDDRVPAGQGGRPVEDRLLQHG